MFSWISIAIASIIGLAFTGTQLRAEIQPDYLMLSDPSFPTAPSLPGHIDHRLVPLWLRALERSDFDLQRQAADAIVAAWRMGFREVESARPALLKLLGQADLPLASRWGAARALIVLETKESAEALFQASEQQPGLRDIVEPALAEWNFTGARAAWRKRIQDPDPNRHDLILALKCAGRLRDAEAIDSIISILRNREWPADVRLAAARAAGQATDRGLETLVDELAPHARVSKIDRICAVSLLIRHQSDEARKKLADFARDSEPTVAAQALRTLHSIDPALVLPLAEDAMHNADGNVRLEGIRCYIVLPTPQRIAVVGRQLSDPHPRNRYFLREEFYRLSRQPELDGPVREAITTALAGDDWRGQEQAALLVAVLDHKPVAPRLVELLESTRPEVMASTAWALRKLAIPETLPAMLDKASRQTESYRDPDIFDPQLAHLFEAMATMDYQPAVPLLRRYVPKSMFGVISRSAAVWALGHLLKSTPDENLGDQLLVRYFDTASIPPEFEMVRRMSAITIGRMKTKRQHPKLREAVGAETDHGLAEYSASWAIEQITGEKIPLAPLPTEGLLITGWFLEPAADSRPEVEPVRP